MTPRPKTLTARHVCGALAVLVIAHCINAYRKSLPRQMAKFENGMLSLTVEEVPNSRFPANLVLGDALTFYYRFTLAQQDVVCSSFTIYGDSTRYKRAEEVKPAPLPKVAEKVLFVCALDGSRQVTCSGNQFRQIHWDPGAIRKFDPQDDRTAPEKPLTFLSDAKATARDKEGTVVYIHFLLEQLGERPPEASSGSAFQDMIVRSRKDRELPLGERFPNAQKLVDLGDAALVPLADYLAGLPDDLTDTYQAAYMALRRIGGPGQIEKVYRDLASKAKTEEERRRFERVIPLFK
jgi:hypothetical protein